MRSRNCRRATRTIKASWIEMFSCSSSSTSQKKYAEQRNCRHHVLTVNCASFNMAICSTRASECLALQTLQCRPQFGKIFSTSCLSFCSESKNVFLKSHTCVPIKPAFGRLCSIYMYILLNSYAVLNDYGLCNCFLQLTFRCVYSTLCAHRRPSRNRSRTRMLTCCSQSMPTSSRSLMSRRMISLSTEIRSRSMPCIRSTAWAPATPSRPMYAV